MKWPGHIVFPHSVLDSVFAHFLCHNWRFSNEIWYIGLSREYTGSIRILVSQIIFGRIMPLGFRKILVIAYAIMVQSGFDGAPHGDLVKEK